MQISRRILLACATAVAVPLLVSAQDTQSQADALEQALHQKMNDLRGQPQAQAPAAPAAPAQAAPAASGNSSALEQALHQKMSDLQNAPAAPVQPSTPPAAVTSVPAVPSTPAAAPAQPPVVSQGNAAALQQALDQKMKQSQAATPSMPVAPAVSSAAPAEKSSAQSQALENALHQKMKQVFVQPPVQAGWSAVRGATPAAAQPAPRAAAPTAGQYSTPALPSQPALNPAELQKANEALRRKMAELNAQQQPAPTATARTKKPSARGSMTLSPLSPPPLPISLTKEEQLQDLLKRYIANQISPEQYHVERAKILGQE